MVSNPTLPPTATARYVTLGKGTWPQISHLQNELDKYSLSKPAEMLWGVQCVCVHSPIPHRKCEIKARYSYCITFFVLSTQLRIHVSY